PDPRLWGVVCVSLIRALAVAAAAQQPRPAERAPLPLTELDARGLAADLDSRTFSLAFAQPVPIKDLLLLLVRGTNVSIVPDPGITGSFIGELKNVTVRQALGLILRPLGLDYAIERGVVRVFKREPETRIFDLNYAIADRVGTSTVSAESGRSTAAVATTTKSDLFDELAKGVRM